MQSFTNQNSESLIFLELHGSNLPDGVTKGNTKKHGHEDQIRLETGRFELANAAMVRSGKYPDGSFAVHYFHVSGLDSLDDLSGENAGLVQGLMTLYTDRTLLDSASLHFCKYINGELETVKTYELDKAKVTGFQNNGDASNTHAFEIIIAAQSGYMSTTPYDDTGAVQSVVKTTLPDLLTLSKSTQ